MQQEKGEITLLGFSASDWQQCSDGFVSGKETCRKNAMGDGSILSAGITHSFIIPVVY